MTWVWMKMAAGWEITACPRDPSVLLLLDFDFTKLEFFKSFQILIGNKKICKQWCPALSLKEKENTENLFSYNVKDDIISLALVYPPIFIFSKTSWAPDLSLLLLSSPALIIQRPINVRHMFYFGNKSETYVVGITKFWLVQLYSVNTDDAAFSLETEATNEAFLMLVGCER